MDSGQYLVQEDVINRLRLTYSIVAQTRPGPKLLIYRWPTTQMRPACIFISNSLHFYRAFLGTQSALHRRGGSPHPPPVCSIHLNDVTAAIVHQNPPHTHQLQVEKRQSDEANRCMGMIRRPWWSEGSGWIWPGSRGYTPTLFRRTSWDF